MCYGCIIPPSECVPRWGEKGKRTSGNKCLWDEFSTTLLRWSHPADINSTNQMSKAQHVYLHLRITAFICDSKPKHAATESIKEFLHKLQWCRTSPLLVIFEGASLTLKCTLLCSTGTMKKKRDNICSLAFGCVYSFTVGKSCLKGLSCLNELYFWESSRCKIYVLSEKNIHHHAVAILLEPIKTL